MRTKLFPAGERGAKDAGWLKSRFTFSFSDYYNPEKSAFGTLVTLNDDLLEAGKGFGTHPHVNMEIISILLRGKMNHKDSMGYNTTLDEGAVQIMSAGSGLFHEEYNIGTEEVNFLQIWIQPKLQDIKPRYQQRSFPKRERLNQLVTLVSNQEGLKHCWINQNAKLSLGYFEQAQKINYTFPKENKTVFIMVLEGGLKLDNFELGKRDSLGIWDTDAIEFTTIANTEFLIIETVINQK